MGQEKLTLSPDDCPCGAPGGNSKNRKKMTMSPISDNPDDDDDCQPVAIGFVALRGAAIFLAIIVGVAPSAAHGLPVLAPR